ncbi:MAG: glycosyltransferase [Clostridia bacterium]|nr:glycosyltransferase [Clostridia bacterium]
MSYDENNIKNENDINNTNNSPGAEAAHEPAAAIWAASSVIPEVAAVIEAAAAAAPVEAGTPAAETAYEPAAAIWAASSVIPEVAAVIEAAAAAAPGAEFAPETATGSAAAIRAESSVIPEARESELEKLKKAYEALLGEAEELKKAKAKADDALKKAKAKADDALKKAKAEADDALKKAKAEAEDKLEKAKAQQKKLTAENGKLKTQLASQKAISESKQRELDQVRVKYDALANSKLGKLTLNYWAKRSKNKAAKTISQLPAVEKVFDKLPSAEELEMKETAAAAVVTAAETKAADAKKADAKAAVPKKAASKKAEEKKAAPKKADPFETAPADDWDASELESWVFKYDDAIEAIPDSNGIRYYNKVKQRIGIIADEFFYESICDAADFVYLTPKNYKETISEGKIDALLLVSAWRGLNNEWVGFAQLKSKTRRTVSDLISMCKERSIPTIFYSKEDPPNYERFLDYAKQCDYVFTSAAECVPYYKEDCGHDKVYDVMFGINPAMHNPIGFYNEKKDKTVLFSGSWMEKYPKRCNELSSMFQGVINSDYDLHIVDRNYGNDKYRYPWEYRKFVSPAVDHKKLQKLHKQFDWAININSVTNSDTMFANRTFELQAAGVLLLSNYSVGVNNVHPTVFMAHESLEVDKILGGFTDEERYEHQIAGIRSVMTGHTCFDRIKELLAPTGIDTACADRSVLVIAETLDESVKASFERQTYENKTLLAQSDVSADIVSGYDMVTWFDAGAYYGEFYLEDMINGFKYTACDYITKDAYVKDDTLAEGVEHNYVNQMKSPYRTVFWREAYDAGFFAAPPEAGELKNGYSIDRFSYREGTHAKPVRETPYLLSVIVPVYNNGAHLYGKCITSLRRSSMFDDMEIILVDDGSTDARTLKIETYLCDRYPNIRRYAFEDGGSGSASRPRNKGVELASAEYITFLDPDNEAICDGYARLYDCAKNEDLDIAFGNIYRCTYRTMLFNYCYQFNKITGKTMFEHGLSELKSPADFYAVSIQAMAIRRSLVMENGIEQVPGAAGQDTLFCWQILMAAQRIKTIEVPIHIYYAQTSGSVTNTVSRRFFEKLMLLQQPKIDWLKSAGFLEEYMRVRNDVYVNGWIFKRLSSASEPVECTRIVWDILKMYAPYYKNTDEIINEFSRLCGEEKYEEAFNFVSARFIEAKQRPMPTIEELSAQIEEEKQRKNAHAVFDIRYKQTDGATVALKNYSGEEGKDQYAWAVLYDSKTYKKVFVTKYESDRTFTYDFSKLAAGSYKVRAFMLKGQEKLSDDVLYITVTRDKIIFISNTRSLAEEVRQK